MSTTGRRGDHARCAHLEPIVQRIRVRIADLPGVMRDLVESIVATQPDMQLVSAEPAVVPDVVIVGLTPDADATALAAHLYDHPHQRILALAIDGRQAVAYELRPYLTELGEISPDALLAAIRAGRPNGGGTR